MAVILSSFCLFSLFLPFFFRLAFSICARARVRRAEKKEPNWCIHNRRNKSNARTWTADQAKTKREIESEREREGFLFYFIVLSDQDSAAASRSFVPSANSKISLLEPKFTRFETIIHKFDCMASRASGLLVWLGLVVCLFLCFSIYLFVFIERLFSRLCAAPNAIHVRL